VLPGGRQQHGDEDREAEVEHGELRQQPETRDEAEQEPEPGPVVLQDQDQDVGPEYPEELVESVHREPGPEDEQGRWDQGRESGEALREAAATQLAGDEPRQHDHASARQRREDVQGHERVAEQRPGDGGHDRDEGREVHVAETQVLSSGDVVELVPEVAVVVGGKEVQQQLGERQVHQDRRGAEEALSEAGRSGLHPRRI
jgi:hypothetical protein